MPTPHDDAGLQYIWEKKENEYTSLGLSRWAALKQIAIEYRVSPRTVYAWLTPESRAKRNKLVVSGEYKKKKRNWAKTPINREKLAKYAKNYYLVRSRLDSYIHQIFLESDRDTLSLEAINNRIIEISNIHLKKVSILAAIAKYNSEHEESPIEEIEPALYRLDI